MWLFIIISAVWVFYDAKSIGVKKGLILGLGNMNPIGWFFATLLLWIISFPLYLLKRREFKQQTNESGISPIYLVAGIVAVVIGSVSMVSLDEYNQLKDKKQIINVDTYSYEHQQAVEHFQSDQETTAQDAIWTADYMFKVAIFDNGSNQDAYASYVCSVLDNYGFKDKNIMVSIVDIIELSQNKQWIELGKEFC